MALGAARGSICRGRNPGVQHPGGEAFHNPYILVTSALLEFTTREHALDPPGSQALLLDFLFNISLSPIIETSAL
jgi:hypothetical protein